MRTGKRKKRRTGLYLVMLVVGIFLSTLVVQGISLRANCQKLAAEQSQLQEKKESLQKEQQEIKEKAQYMKTDKYIEDIAREKFGLVYEDEIIFKAADSE
ncbi:MAG: septum formation initiator family protein [Lachnospiraceae bacterium]|nr:septum formation initiator family protein [Lachnospiraceae bacterium]